MGRSIRGVLVITLVLATLVLAPTSGAAARVAPVPRVEGNTLVGADGQPLRLLGVDRAGTEYACIQGWGIFDGPTDAGSIAAIRAWGANAVRVPLNEDCWLGRNANPSLSGEAYRGAIEGFVRRLNDAGMVAVLDLHWSGTGTSPSSGQTRMADALDAPTFWSSVASRFRTNPSVVFDLYNEPHDISWACWRDGCEGDGGRFAGMQQLVDAVRSTGATQPLMATGLRYGNDLSEWLTYRPSDPRGQLVAGFHVYNFNACVDAACWDGTVGAVARQVPVVTGELGEDDCSPAFANRYMDWADRNGVSYLAWAWNPYGCGAFPALITGYDGTPTPFGVGIRDRLLRLSRTPTPTPSPSATPTPTPTPTPKPTPTLSATPTATPTPSATPTPAPTATAAPGGGAAGLAVELRSAEPRVTDNHLRPHLRLANAGAPVALSELTVRYWYSEPSQAGQQAHCDWAAIGCRNLSTRFGAAGAARYLEVAFGPGAGTLGTGRGTGDIQLRANKVDWSNFDERDDWSYLPGGAFARAERVTLYHRGRLVWGREPS